MYDILAFDTIKTQEKNKYLPKSVHFTVHNPPQRHKNNTTETSNSQYTAYQKHPRYQRHLV